MPISPGTVSKILWHFTGGPRWNEKEQRQENQPKPIDDACAALVSILRSRELRIRQYKEVVKVIVPYVNECDPTTLKISKRYNVPLTILSAPVCCLADIPIMHLGYHAERYGKIAIGFHRDAVIRHGFSPVFYQLAGLWRKIYLGFTLQTARKHEE